MDVNTKRSSHRWLYVFLLSLFLLPVFSSVTLLGGSSLLPTGTVAFAADSSSSSDGSLSTESSLDPPSSNTRNDWNRAIGTLSTNATTQQDYKKPTAKNTPDNIGQVIGKNPMNAWGYMGPANTDVWTSNNHSSWAVSYQSLLTNAKNKLANAKSGVKIDHTKSLQTNRVGYQAAARFAYAMQSSGLDKPVKSGFGSISVLQKTAGFGLELSYYVLQFANNIFKVLLQIAADINPLHWIVSAAENGSSTAQNASNMQGFNYITNDGGTSDGNRSSALTPFRNAVVTYYSWFSSIGWLIMGIFLICGLAMGALGITVGQSGGYTGQTKALISTVTTFFKRLFVWVMVPIFSLSMYNFCITTLQNSFATDSGSVGDYAVFGAFVDYSSWVNNSRLAIPRNIGSQATSTGSNGKGLDASFVSGNNPSLSHGDIVTINYLGAGVPNLDQLYNDSAAGKDGNTDSAKLEYKSQVGDDAASTLTATPTKTIDSSTSITQQSDNSGDAGARPSLDVLSRWTAGTTITAADYASTLTPYVQDALAKDPPDTINGQKDDSANDNTIADELVLPAYNENGTNVANGDPTVNELTNNSIPTTIGSHTIASSSDDPFNVPPTADQATASGGLSTLGLYNYMLTTASDDGMTIANTDNLANDVSLPGHYSVNLVGTGVTATGNALWALGLMGGMALIIAGYAFEIFKSLIHSIPAVVLALFQTALASVKGGVQLLSVITGLILGTVGSAFLFRFSQIAFISFAEYADYIMHSTMFVSTVNSFLTLGNHTQIGALTTSPATYNMITGAFNILFGLFLLFLAIMLLRYRGIIISALASIVEETVNKILASFGNVSGTGSAGTRGAISQNTNTSSTWGNNASSIITRGGMGALMAGGAGAGLLGLNKAAKGAGKGVGGTGKNNLSGKASGKNAAAQASGLHNTSSGKTGNAAAAMGKQNAQRQGSQLGTSGKGINDASQHAPAGQGQGRSTGVGQGQGQHQGMTQGQGQGQNQMQGQLGGNVNGLGTANGQATGQANNNNNGQSVNSSNNNYANNDQPNGIGDQNGNNSNLEQRNGDSSTIGGSNLNDTANNNLGDNGATMGQGNNGDVNQNSRNGDMQNSNRTESNNGDLRQLGNNESTLGQSNMGQGLQNASNTQDHNNTNMNNNNSGDRISDLSNSSQQLGDGQNGGITNNNDSSLGQNTGNAAGQNIDNDNLNQSDSRMTNGGIGDTYSNNDSDNNTIGDSDSGVGNNTGDTQMDNSQINSNDAGNQLNDATNNNSNLGQGLGAGNDSSIGNDTSNINNNDSSLNQGDTAGDVNSSNLGGNNQNSNLGGTSHTNSSIGGVNQAGNRGDTNASNLQNAVNHNGMSNISGNNLNSDGGSINNSDNSMDQGNSFGENNNTSSTLGDTGNDVSSLGGDSTGVDAGNDVGTTNDGSITNSDSGIGNTNNSNTFGDTTMNSNDLGQQGLGNNTNDAQATANGGDSGTIGSSIGGTNDAVNGLDGTQGANGNATNGNAIGNAGSSINNNNNSNLGQTTNGATNLNGSHIGGNNAISNLGANQNQSSIGGDSNIQNAGNGLTTGDNNNIANQSGINDSSNTIGGMTNGDVNSTLGGTNVNGNASSSINNGINDLGQNVNNSSQLGQNVNNNSQIGQNATSGLQNGTPGVNGLNGGQTLGQDQRDNTIGAVGQGQGNSSIGQVQGNSIGQSQDSPNNMNNMGDTSNGLGQNATNALTGGTNDVSGLNPQATQQPGEIGQNAQNNMTQNNQSTIGQATNGLSNGQPGAIGQTGNDGASIGQTGGIGNPQSTDTPNTAPQADVSGNGLSTDNPGATLGGNTGMTGLSGQQPNTQPQGQGESIGASIGSTDAPSIGGNVGNTTQQPSGNSMPNIGGNAGSIGNTNASQPISQGMPQANWVSGNTSNLSVGSVNNAMNSVYNAQQNVQQATSRYGANSPQAQTAQTALSSARDGAIKSGLSANVISNPTSVTNAHNTIMGGGSQGTGGSNNGGNGSTGGNGNQRTIGI